MRVNIIGGGLAGCALAYVLKVQGCTPVIYEAGASLAAGASGNEVGLYNPRFTAEYTPIAAFYSTAFHHAVQVFETLGASIDWNPCGALHLMNTDQKRKRYPKTVASWGWGADDMRLVTAAQATAIAGVTVGEPCLYLPRSGMVSPRKLCAAYVEGVEVHLKTRVEDINDLPTAPVVIANGMGAKHFTAAAHLPLKPVRGQVSTVGATAQSRVLKTALCYGGYIAPAQNDTHCIGATFQRWLDHTETIPQDDQDNIAHFERAIGYHGDPLIPIRSRAGLRTTSHDHAPIIGALDDTLYISTAHGSHGILSSLMGACILRDALLQKTQSLSRDSLSAVSPARFGK